MQFVGNFSAISSAFLVLTHPSRCAVQACGSWCLSITLCFTAAVFLPALSRARRHMSKHTSALLQIPCSLYIYFRHGCTTSKQVKLRCFALAVLPN